MAYNKKKKLRKIAEGSRTDSRATQRSTSADMGGTGGGDYPLPDPYQVSGGKSTVVAETDNKATVTVGGRAVNIGVRPGDTPKRWKASLLDPGAVPKISATADSFEWTDGTIYSLTKVDGSGDPEVVVA